MRSCFTVSRIICRPHAWTLRKPTCSHFGPSRPEDNARPHSTRPTFGQTMRRAYNPSQYHDLRAFPIAREPLPPLAALATFSGIVGRHHSKRCAISVSPYITITPGIVAEQSSSPSVTIGKKHPFGESVIVPTLSFWRRSIGVSYYLPVA